MQRIAFRLMLSSYVCLCVLVCVCVCVSVCVCVCVFLSFFKLEYFGKIMSFAIYISQSGRIDWLVGGPAEIR